MIAESLGKVLVKFALRSDGVSGPAAKDKLLLSAAKQPGVKKTEDTAFFSFFLFFGHLNQERH